MTQHVFAWVTGFGWTLMPFAPFRFERSEERPWTVSVERSGAARAVVALERDGRAGGFRAVLQPGSAADVVELIEGPAYAHADRGADYDHWRIETSLFNVRWPAGFALRSVADAPPVFELTGPDGRLIWVQGPFDSAVVPSPDGLAAPDQTLERVVASAGGPLVELRYEHGGRPWNMFHAVVDRFAGAVCIVTGQTPTEGREPVRRAVEELAASLTPLPGE